MREKLLNEWKKEFGDDFKLWSELGWWIEQLEQALQADRAQLVERVRGMKEYYGLSPKQKGAKKYNPEKNGYIEGYSQALEDVLSVLEVEEHT